MLTRGLATAAGRWFTRVSRRLEDLSGPEAAAAAHQQAATASFLAEASRVLANSLDYEETLTAVARLVVPGLADCCAKPIDPAELATAVATQAGRSR